MRLLYNLLFMAGFILTAPYYFWRLWRRGNWVKGFPQRFGEFDKNIRQAITNRHVVWIHAVSVGEVNVCVEFVRALQARVPNAKLVISTTTTTGMAELHKKLPGMFGKIYYPIDRRKYVDLAIRVLHPSAIVLVETEVWPNFVWRAQASGIPLFLINGRLSERSYPRYRKLGFLFRDLFKAFTGVGVQTTDYGRQFEQIGCCQEAVHVTGNLKFDAARIDTRSSTDAAGLLRQAGAASNALVLVAGSTHAGEEEILADMFLRLRKEFPALFLVLVPRHFERARDAGRAVGKKLRLVYRSEIEAATRAEPGSADCLLVDTTGELMSFYTSATVAFVGKSLSAKGGQNPIEPAALGIPSVFGPNMQNFQDVARILVKAGGAAQVRDAAGVEKTVRELLQDPAKRQQMGQAALEAVKQNRGATSRTIEMILPHLAAQGLYIAPEAKTGSESRSGNPAEPAGSRSATSPLVGRL